MGVPVDQLRTLPLLWRGPLADPSGYADEARTFLLALERSGYAVAARPAAWAGRPVELPTSQRRAVERATAREAPEGAVTVEHRMPVAGAAFDTRGCTVVRTMFETDSIPVHWLPLLIGVDEIWVPTEFNVETFQRGGLPGDRLRVLPGTLDFELFDPGAGVEPLPVEGRRGFVFLTNFDFTERKGWDVLLDAWADAFDPDDDVCLLLKCATLHIDEAGVRRRIAAHLDGRATAPILLDTTLLRADEMPRLYAAADAYVLASRGEGWGRPSMEAMAMGLPTIGSAWSGTTAFMHEGNSVLVAGDVRPVRSWDPLPPALWLGHRWFEPDRDALAAALRLVYSGSAEVTARAAGARADLLARFGPEVTAARVAELTGEALERHAWRRSRPVACVWRGRFGSGSSLAVVNDALVGALEGDDGLVERLAPASDPVESAGVGVAAHWPPDFDAPTDGPFVIYQPWEFGEVPAAWVEPIRRRVDEVWTASEYSRRAFVAAGVAPELVHVVPNGVDLARFRPGGPVHPLPERAATVFLFVGGTTYRKGIDVLLAAYERAFTAADDVLLVVKGFGSDTVYRGQTAEAAVKAFAATEGAPRVLLLDDDLPYDALPALYRAADCLVQPYRGEGFCLPALEALACGVPAIVTAGGPTDDFATDACAWRVAAATIPLPPGIVPAELAPAHGGSLLEPDVDAVAAALRDAADPARRAAKAAAARPHAERFGWAQAAAAAAARLALLRGRTPVRTVAAAAVPGARDLVFVVDADWRDPATWAPALDAYAAAFGPDDPTTLVLATTDEAAAAAAVERHLAGADAAALADVVLADSSGVAGTALELAGDAHVCTRPHRPLRARRVLPPEPAALRALLAP